MIARTEPALNSRGLDGAAYLSKLSDHPAAPINNYVSTITNRESM